MTEFALGSQERPLRVAVVGSGPSGFYAIGALLKQKDVHVTADLFDRLPTPFGLVRGGVAPDHQKIKNVTRIYERIGRSDGVRFFGNVVLGRDIQMDDLTKHYDQIVLATGNESDRKMGLPGEDLDGVYSATEFVGWYNGHPEFANRDFSLASAKRAAVVGNGNVAMDVVRVLARHPDELAPTDIADYAIDALRTSTVDELTLYGRRGPAQAAFSPKEIREVGTLDGVDLVVGPKEVDVCELTLKWVEEKADKSARKNLDYLGEVSARGPGTNQTKIHCSFLASPVEFIGEDGKLTGVKLERNELYEDDRGTPRPRGTGEYWVEPVDLIFKAIGYRGVPIPGVPFHESWGIFPNEEGRLTDKHGGNPIPGQYVVGWAKRGPTGLIGTNQKDSVATVEAMLADIEGVVVSTDPNKSEDAIVAFLEANGIEYVSYQDWELLDQEELRLGKERGKIREKFSNIDDMMAAIRRLKAEQ